MSRLAALVLCLVGLAGCRGGAAPPQPASPPADAGADAGGYATGTVDAFRASLFLAADPERFVAAVRAAGDAVELPVVSRAGRGEEIVAFVAVQDCSAGEDGLCDVVVDFELRDSSGELKAKQTDVGLWRDPPEPAPGAMLFGEAALTLTIAADARPGTWKLTARVTDRAAADTVTLRAALQVE
ncbi:MAG: hypothetical protein SF182_08950 [Deltaproteobacteria bacterium]|nr:hypothetical protein [Deltaproteobacteria bacterium]